MELLLRYISWKLLHFYRLLFLKSYLFEQNFTINTGKNDVNELGKVVKWNNKK